MLAKNKLVEYMSRFISILEIYVLCYSFFFEYI